MTLQRLADSSIAQDRQRLGPSNGRNQPSVRNQPFLNDEVPDLKPLKAQKAIVTPQLDASSHFGVILLTQPLEITDSALCC
jgi:hypothetical protein